MLENASAAQIDSLVRSVPKELDEVHKKMLATSSNQRITKIAFHITLAAGETLELAAFRTFLAFKVRS